MMPSHKHKKKKRSHKHHQKKHVSSSSDDDYILCKVHFSQSESDDCENEEKLTSLVRESYKSHLQQALSQNFEGWVNNSNGVHQDTLQVLVSKWSSVLEQKALRACMVSELYRKTMASLIKQIRSSTSDGRLYIEERSLTKLRLKLPMNKESQTDKLKVISAETQTQIPLTSLLDLPLPTILPLSPASRPYDPAINFCDNDTGVTSSLAPHSPSPGRDGCNITSTSDLSDPAQFLFGSVRTTDITNALDILGIRPQGTDADSQSCKDQLTTENSTLEVVSSNSENIARTRHLIKCNTKTKVRDRNKENLQNLRKHPVRQESCSSNLQDNLDARLTAMGLLGDFGSDTENTNSQLPIAKFKKSNWYAEEVAQSCNLTRILMRLPTRQRERVLRRIKELFGDENESLMELTDQNIAICRKRIASVVVMELTPIYQGKRIASRHLFKFLAKKITKALMEQTYAPDTRSIRLKVKEFFSDGRVIMSESDCI